MAYLGQNGTQPPAAPSGAGKAVAVVGGVALLAGIVTAVAASTRKAPAKNPFAGAPRKGCGCGR